MKRRLYYGWVITFTLAITELISWGIIYYAFTVFITPMEAELGWSRAELTGGFSLAMLVMGVMGVPIGTWIDRHGARWLMTAGSIGAAVLVAAWSQVTDKTAYYLIFAGLGVCGAAVLYEPAFAVVATWFERKRSRALAVITFSAGLASTLFVPLTEALKTSFGWRDAGLILAALLALTTILPHALVLRRRPSDLGLLPDGGEESSAAARPARPSVTFYDAVRSRVFWTLIAAFSLASFATAAIRVHIIPFLIDAGVDSGTAALVSGAIGLMQVAGRVVFAPLESRLSVRALVTGVFAIEAAAMGLLLFGAFSWIIGGFVIAFGMAYGAQTLARATVIADSFGVLHYGRISSVMGLFLIAASTTAPLAAALIYDSTGTYTPVLWIIVVLAILAAGVMVMARPKPFPAMAGAAD